MRSHDPARGAELWRPDSGTSMMLKLSLVCKVPLSQSIWVVFICTTVPELPVIIQGWFICWISQVSGKESTCNSGVAGDAGSIPGSGRFPGEGNGNPLQYSRLENPMDRGAWWATVHGVANHQTRLKQLSMHARFICSRVNRHVMSSCWMSGVLNGTFLIWTSDQWSMAWIQSPFLQNSCWKGKLTGLISFKGPFPGTHLSWFSLPSSYKVVS